MMVEVTSDCDITVTPIGAGNFVPAMWTGGSAPYAALQACPAAGDSGLTASSTSSSLLADLGSLLAGAIWDTPLATAPTITTGTGIVTIADGSCTLKYRVSDDSGAGFAGVTGVACTSGAECGAAPTGCNAAGTYAVPVASASGYICALCPPGERRPSCPELVL